MGANEKHEATYHGGEYVPGTVRVRQEYINGRRFGEIYSKRDFGVEFDRWLAQVKSDAWDEGSMASESLSCANPPCGACEGCSKPLINPYREQ